MSQLTNEQKETVIIDFKEWTGGYVPSEVTEGRVKKYVRIAGALSAEFDKPVKRFLLTLQTDGFIGENEFLKSHDQDNLLRLSEQARYEEMTRNAEHHTNFNPNKTMSTNKNPRKELLDQAIRVMLRSISDERTHFEEMFAEDGAPEDYMMITDPEQMGHTYYSMLVLRSYLIKFSIKNWLSDKLQEYKDISYLAGIQGMQYSKMIRLVYYDAINAKCSDLSTQEVDSIHEFVSAGKFTKLS